MIFRETQQRGVLGLLLVALVGQKGASAVLLGVLLGVVPFVDFPKVLDTRSSYDPFVHIHNNKYLHISTFHHGVYRKSCMLGNFVYTRVASLLLEEN